MGDHPKSMDAGVGAAGTMNTFYARKNFSERFLNALLNAQADFLHLPTGVVRPVVGDGEFEFHRIRKILDTNFAN